MSRQRKSSIPHKSFKQTKEKFKSSKIMQTKEKFEIIKQTNEKFDSSEITAQTKEKLKILECLKVKTSHFLQFFYGARSVGGKNSGIPCI